MENNNEELQPQETPKSKKLSTTMLVIGIPILILGIIFAIIAFVSMGSDLFFLGFIGLPLIAIGFSITSIGLRPYLAKFNAQLGKETLDYAGTDLGQTAQTGVDVYSPAATKMAKAIKEGLSEEESDPQKFCKHCGKSIDADSKFCSECGERQ